MTETEDRLRGRAIAEGTTPEDLSRRAVDLYLDGGGGQQVIIFYGEVKKVVVNQYGHEPTRGPDPGPNNQERGNHDENSGKHLVRSP